MLTYLGGGQKVALWENCRGSLDPCKVVGISNQLPQVFKIRPDKTRYAVAFYILPPSFPSPLGSFLLSSVPFSSSSLPPVWLWVEEQSGGGGEEEV